MPASGCAKSKADARASGPTRRVLQVHPTLRCNLKCAHCYSSSGPAVRVELDLGSVCAAVSDARELGFDVLSVSGGEPFVYRWLPELLTHARNLGMQTTVTSNGTVLTDARLDRVDGLIDGMALSVDGPPDMHDELRRSAGSFDRLCDGLSRVRERGIPFGIIHTLTERSWRHLPWVAAFAANHGGALLQVHPLELTGRAATQLGSGDPRADTLGRAYLLCKALEGRYAPDLAIQLDVLLRRDIVADPELVYALPGGDAIPGRLPADRLGSLVLEADGTLVPVSYGFGRSYALGNGAASRCTRAGARGRAPATSASAPSAARCTRRSRARTRAWSTGTTSSWRAAPSSRCGCSSGPERPRAQAIPTPMRRPIANVTAAAASPIAS